MGPVLLTHSKIAAESLISLAGELYKGMRMNTCVVVLNNFGDRSALRLLQHKKSHFRNYCCFFFFCCVRVCFHNLDHVSDLVSMEAH